MIHRTGNHWSPPPTQPSGGSNELGKDAFLKLLLTQMANQDPLSPQDSQAFVAQLAQFATVEQLQGVGSRLDSLVLAQAASNQTGVATLAGKEVRFASRTVPLEKGIPVSFTGDLAADAAQVDVIIKDSAGRVVRTLHLDARSKGEQAIVWDGLDDRGNELPSGEYDVQITAKDGAGKNVDVKQWMRARVDGVSFEKGFPELIIGSLRVSLSDVIDIYAV
ncbi:MAG TPA: flagellar hook capping FlgD N-terminal domain-containing protein [Vulgatibacter sp.]|nr:flagellar hook capping FlgD N-terminal domain-containing protein [Vulgatibacter sp.]